MRTQTEVEQLLRDAYVRIGGNPADILQVVPNDGSWENALTYTVKRADGKQTRVFRKDLDDREDQKINATLRGFR